MRFCILGSGGCVALPKPLCQCPVCVQAREKGTPYSRRGPSLYCEDVALLIDTPEDIVQSLNAQHIKKVDRIAYSHWDPDHTLGMRVMEHLRMDWYAKSIGDFHPVPVEIMALDGTMADINNIRSPYGSFLGYYEQTGLIARQVVEDTIRLGDITLTLVPVNGDRRICVFLFEQGGCRLIYAPCDVKPFPEDDRFRGADVMIIGNTMVGPTIKGGVWPAAGNELLRELFTMEEIVRLQAEYGIGKVIVTHLEEDWGKSYDDYAALEKRYENVQFAYDGMEIIL